MAKPPRGVRLRVTTVSRIGERSVSEAVLKINGKAVVKVPFDEVGREMLASHGSFSVKVELNSEEGRVVVDVMDGGHPDIQRERELYSSRELIEFSKRMQAKDRELGVLWDGVCPKCGLRTVRFRDGTELTWPEL